MSTRISERLNDKNTNIDQTRESQSVNVNETRPPQWNRLEALCLKILGAFSEQYKKNYEDYCNNYIKSFMDHSGSIVHGGKLMNAPDKEPYKLKFIDHKLVAQLATNKNTEKNNGEIGVVTDVATRIIWQSKDGKKKIERIAYGKEQGKIYPTSNLHGLEKSNGDLKNKLFNAYKAVVNIFSGKSYSFSRTGVVDTKEKMKSFLEMVKTPEQIEVDKNISVFKDCVFFNLNLIDQSDVKNLKKNILIFKANLFINLKLIDDKLAKKLNDAINKTKEKEVSEIDDLENCLNDIQLNFTQENSLLKNLKIENETSIQTVLTLIQRCEVNNFQSTLTKVNNEFENIDNILNQLFTPIASTSLLSRYNSGEKRMIDRQHALMTRHRVAHFNLQSNSWYKIANAVKDKSSRFGKFLQKISGETHSRMQNLDSWPLYLNWLAKDSNNETVENNVSESMVKSSPSQQTVEKNGNIPDEVRKKISKLQTQFNVIQSVFEKLSNPKLDKKTKIGLKKQLVEGRKAIYSELKEIHAQLANNVEPKVRLVHRLLSAQLGIKHVDRGEEGMCLFALQHLFQVNSAINCKSGLDRTGFWSGVNEAQVQYLAENAQNLEKTNDFIELCLNWDRISHTLALKESVEGLEEVENWLKELKPEADADCKLMKLAHSFREQVNKNLIENGLIVTVLSTGLIGFKWGKGFNANPIPLPFLAPIKIKQTIIEHGTAKEVTKYISVVKYSKGKFTMTEEGHRYFTRLSGGRGS